MIQLQFAVQVPEPVFPDRTAVNVKVLTVRLTLGPVTNVVHIQHLFRSTHFYQHTGENHAIFQPSWTLEAAMNQQAMQTDGMSEAQRKSGQQTAHG